MRRDCDTRCGGCRVRSQRSPAAPEYRGTGLRGIRSTSSGRRECACGS
jgi:hypothetical protein